MIIRLEIKDEDAREFSEHVDKHSDSACSAQDAILDCMTDLFKSFIKRDPEISLTTEKPAARYPSELQKRINLYSMFTSMCNIIEVDIEDYIKKLKNEVSRDARATNESYYLLSKGFDLLMTVQVVPHIEDVLKRS